MQQQNFYTDNQKENLQVMSLINFKQQEVILPKYSMCKIRNLLLLAARNVVIQNCIKGKQALDGTF